MNFHNFWGAYGSGEYLEVVKWVELIFFKRRNLYIGNQKQLWRFSYVACKKSWQPKNWKIVDGRWKAEKSHIWEIPIPFLFTVVILNYNVSTKGKKVWKLIMKKKLDVLPIFTSDIEPNVWQSTKRIFSFCQKKGVDCI